MRTLPPKLLVQKSVSLHLFVVGKETKKQTNPGSPEPLATFIACRGSERSSRQRFFLSSGERTDESLHVNRDKAVLSKRDESKELLRTYYLEFLGCRCSLLSC